MSPRFLFSLSALKNPSSLFYVINKNLEANFITFYKIVHHSIEQSKAPDMKNTSTNREILLLSNSSYFKRDWAELTGNKNNKKLSQKAQLILLCWNGMLKEMIPEIVQNEPGKKPLTLWEINESGNMLDLRYGDIDQEMNDEWSINPYVYLTFAIAN